MDDRDAIEAFVNEGAQRAFGETVHTEGDVLLLDGYWHILMRVGDSTFIVRDEEPPIETKVFEQIADVLEAKGLSKVASDLPGITVLTMEKASLGYVSWHVWATDLATALAAVAAGVTDDSFMETGSVGGSYSEPAPLDKDYSAEYHGARRLAGLPTSLVLTVGLDAQQEERLGGALEDCHFINKRLGQIEADACCSLIPTLVLVAATEQQGRDFIMQVRAAACGRVIPVVGITPDANAPLGADLGVLAGSDPATWVEPIRNLLP